MLTIILTACASMPNPRGKPLPVQTFSHLRPLQLNVAARDIQITPAQTETNFVHPIDDMMRAYLQHKIQPTGTDNILVATLDEASVTTKPKTSPNRAADVLHVGRFDTYDVKLKLRFEHKDDLENLLYGTVINAERTIQVSEHASIATREKAQLEGLEQLFLDIDKRVEQVLKRDMGL